jgi:hypothetical protein
METQYSLRLLKNVFLEIDHRYTPINTDNTDGSFMGGWVVIGLLSISHDLLAPLLIHIRRKFPQESLKGFSMKQFEYNLYVSIGH